MMQSPNFPPPTVRSSNFELLRIFCMLFIMFGMEDQQQVVAI